MTGSAAHVAWWNDTANRWSSTSDGLYLPGDNAALVAQQNLTFSATGFQDAAVWTPHAFHFGHVEGSGSAAWGPGGAFWLSGTTDTTAGGETFIFALRTSGSVLASVSVVMAAGAASGKNFQFFGRWGFYTIGATGTLIGNGQLFHENETGTPNTHVDSNATTRTFNTTSGGPTITLSVNCDTANAGNIAHCNVAYVGY